jgi:hypothetical protein
MVDADTGIFTGTPTGKPGEYQVKVTVSTALGPVTGTRAVILTN